MYYLCSENKGADQLSGYGKLICVFVLAYTDSWFSQEATRLSEFSYKIFTDLLIDRQF